MLINRIFNIIRPFVCPWNYYAYQIITYTLPQVKFNLLFYQYSISDVWILINDLSNYQNGYNKKRDSACLFVCLFGVLRPTREFFSHLETSPFPVKSCKFWPLLDPYGHWAMRVLYRATPSVTRGICLYVTLSPNSYR